MRPGGPFRGLLYAVPISLLVWALLILGAIALAPESGAAPLCEVRSPAHIAKYGGLAKDSAEHVARGELPTCDPEAAPAPVAKERAEAPEEKSRYCKKKWYC